MSKAMAGSEVLASFSEGERVCLSEKVIHPEFRGLHGTVKRTIKSRGLVNVICDNGQRYDAFPENIRR